MDSRVFESLKPSDMKMSEALLLGSTYPGYMWSNAQCCRVGQMLQVFGLNKDEYGPTRVFMHQWGEVIGKLWPWTLQYDHRNHVNVVGEVVVEYLNSLVNHKSVGHTLSTLSGCHRKTIPAGFPLVRVRSCRPKP